MKDKKRIIEVNNLVKKYKKAEKAAVDGVSFYVEEGAFFSLLGPNGAGKTTIISILTTLLKPTEGSALLDGFDIATNPNKVRELIGVIFQKPSLDVNLTAEENIRFHANLYGLFPYRVSYSLMPEAYRRRVEMLAQVLGLEQKALHQPVKNLSGGMKRKFEIIRSLMHRPKVLFLDEPTTGLDPVSRRGLWEYLQTVRAEEKTTIFLTTHYLEEAEGADYVCIIDNGKLIAKGTPIDIKASLIEKFMLVDAKDRKGLKEALNKMQADYSGEGPFRVAPNGLDFQEILTKIPQKLNYIDIHNPSLEDAYLQIIKNQNDE